MAPKPFNPPRPSASASTSTSTTKKAGRPKTSGITKSKTKATKENGKEKRISDSKRVSAAALARLPSLSPDSDEQEGDGRGGDGEEEEAEESDDPFASPPPKSKSKSKPQENTPEQVAQRKAIIPPALLSVLIHEMFTHGPEGKEKGTRMGQGAGKAVGMYIDTFVREAVARAAWEVESRGNEASAVLEVEDLERLAPQLVLDF